MKQKHLITYLTIFILCLFLSSLQTNYDYDFWARIIVGERFIEQGILPYHDFLSYTPVHNWYDHEWGSGVVFYFVLKYFGAFGIILLQSALVFGITFFVSKTQRLQKHAYPISIAFMTFLVVLINYLNTLIRCQLFSFFFFSMFLYFLEKNRKQGSNLVWLIPVLTIIWNNLHGGIVSGLGLVFMYLVGAVLDRKPFWKYFGVLSVSTLLLVINPYGLKYLNFLISATTMNRKYVVEWWPVWFGGNLFRFIVPSLYGILAYVLSFFSRNKFNKTRTAVLAMTLYFGLVHVKLLSLVVIAASALCYNEIFGIFSKFKNFFKKLEKSVCLAIIALALLIPFSSPNYARVDFKKYPIYEVEFLKANNLKGNVVVPFALGSYFSYKLYPDNLIYMDGRYEEVYNDKEFLALRDYELAEENWRDIVNNYNTDILMPLKTVDIYNVLKNDPEWVHIFDGRLCGIFLRKGKEKRSYTEPEYNLDYYKKTLFDAKTFGKNLKQWRKHND